MKSIIVFYSLEGNTRLIAEKIVKTIKCDILELKPKNEVKSGGFSKYLWGGKQVLFKEKPKLLPIDKNVSEYDLIILGSPIWAGKYAPVFNTFLSENKIINKKIALFNCNGGGKSDKFFQQFREALKGNEFVGEISFKDPIKEDSENNLIQAGKWAEKIKESI